MTENNIDIFMDAIKVRKEKVYAHLMRPEYAERFQPDHIRSAAYSYIKYGGKSLRAAVLLLSCGAVGGQEDVAIPAAAAVEVYHTWTLVHDDIIDRDDKRRGLPTIHTEYTKIAREEMGFDEIEAAHYGLTIGLLTGDLQQAWPIFLLAEVAQNHNVNAALVLNLLSDLTGRLAPTLIAGETLDVQYSKESLNAITEELVLDMLWKKTGALYEFAGQAGAAIGLGDVSLQDPMVRNIAAFCGKCGTAFQLQDDILGIVGDESKLGKPVGSDIREGKRTTITLHAFKHASPTQRSQLQKILGKPDANDDDIQTATNILHDLGGIDYTQNMANTYVQEAIPLLNILPPSNYKDLLIQWAEYLIKRKF